jgi:hypothetical protein
MRQAVGHPPRIHKNEEAFDTAERLAFYPEPQLAQHPEHQRLTRALGGRSEATSAIFNILLLALGGTPVWDSQPPQETTRQSLPELTPEELIARTASQHPSLKHHGLGAAPPQPEDVRSLFADLAGTGLLNPTKWPIAIANTRNRELSYARGFARAYAEDLPIINQAAAGQDPYHLLLLSERPLHRDRNAILDRVRHLGMGLVFFHLSNPEIQENITAIERTASQIRRELEALKQ